MQAYKGAQYADAVDYFKTAVQLDPDNTCLVCTLATAYMSQYIPGAESPENLQLAKQAKDGVPQGAGKEPQRHHRSRIARLVELSAGAGHAGPGFRSSRSSTKPRNGTSS